MSVERRVRPDEIVALINGEPVTWQAVAEKVEPAVVAPGALAALAARSTSSGVPSGMLPMTSSVVELVTSIVPVPVEGTHAPST